MKSRPDKTYAYEGGNLKRAGARHFKFDSADRLVGVGSTAGASDLLSVVYDAAGERIYEQTPSGSRGFVGPDIYHGLPREAGGHEWRVDIRAFGERVAYVTWRGGWDLAASAHGPFEVPWWLWALVPLAGLGWGLGLAMRGGLIVGVVQRPATASLSGLLIVSLVIPSPLFAGGGGTWVDTPFVYRWVLSDRLGSAVTVLEETGLVVHQTRFKPFGGIDDEYHAAPDPQQRRFFAGHEEQKETGLVYMNARWQDPETGTFLSVDPVVADYHDPQSLNAYSYARNNPVNLTDPTGKFIEEITVRAKASSGSGFGGGMPAGVSVVSGVSLAASGGMATVPAQAPANPSPQQHQ